MKSLQGCTGHSLQLIILEHPEHKRQTISTHLTAQKLNYADDNNPQYVHVSVPDIYE